VIKNPAAQGVGIKVDTIDFSTRAS